jgi:NitT/TauT family transport system substrate-binding protein
VIKTVYAAVILTVILITSCSATNPESDPTRVMVPVNIQLSWIHEYSSSAFHTAVRNNHFAEQGIDVTLSEGGFNDQGYIDPVQEVISGNADFAMSDGVSLIQARAAGLPVVGIAAVLQRSPLVVISLPETGITTPQDLVGHTVGVASGGATILFNNFLQLQDIDANLVNIVPRTSFGIDPLVNGEVDALVGWIINEGVTAQEQGLHPQFMLLSDYGIATYDFVLFTTETVINDKPEVVRGVIAAFHGGLQDMIGDPEKAIEHTLTFNSELSRDEQLRRLQATVPLINLPGQSLGKMDRNFWEFTHNFLLEYSIIDQPIDIDEVYTIEFIYEHRK